jgi:hypothetical protein
MLTSRQLREVVMAVNPVCIPIAAFVLAGALLTVAGQLHGADPITRTVEVPPAYVNVTVELYGIDESAAIIHRSAVALAARIDALGTEVDGLSGDDLERVTVLVAEMSAFTQGLERLLAQSALAIEQARAPVKAMAADVLSEARTTAIDPALERIDGAITKLLVVALGGVIVGLALTLWAVVRTGSYLREVSERLRSIADEYELRPKSPGAQR